MWSVHTVESALRKHHEQLNRNITMNNSANIQVEGTQIQIPLEAKKYASGKVGFYAYKKLVTKNNQYTIQVMLISVPPKKK